MFAVRAATAEILMAVGTSESAGLSCRTLWHGKWCVGSKIEKDVNGGS